MQRDAVTERIRKFIVERFPLARSLNNDDYLLGNGLMDSLGILEVVTFLEDEFRMTVTDEELLPENFQSLTALATFAQHKLDGVLVHQSEK
jgi:acyl carrier protein